MFTNRDIRALAARRPPPAFPSHPRRHAPSELLAEAAAAGAIRTDTAPAQLASYTVHALAAAADLPDEAAVHHLVGLVTTGLRLSV